ncbi:MAG: SDR family NAD(P)-dependent oxidoreductase [Hyphomicrobiaceae bacterium]
MSIERKVSIVTGSARGIGRACARALAERGHAVVLVDVLLPEMERTRAEIEASGVPTLAYEADVASHARAREVVADVMQRWGRIDVLVNNAGRSAPKGILEISEDEWDQTIDVNLKSCFNWIQASAPHMLAAGHGRIVSLSSLNAHSGGVTAAVSKFAYAASKAGVIGLTRALAKELGPSILVNCVCPGLIKTDLVAKALMAEREQELVSGIALKRPGTPEDVAELIAFLATSEPCYITGQDITIDGMQWNR